MASRIFKTMTCLISHVLSLPPDVIGAQVLCFLKVEDMVRFDSAVVTKRYRLPVEDSFARCTVDLRDNDQANQRRNIWRWCTKRLVNIKKLQFSLLYFEDNRCWRRCCNTASHFTVPCSGTAVRRLMRTVPWLQS
jgi:hypothetical protein